VLQSAVGFFLRYSVEEIPEQKKTAQGVRGIKLAAGDTVENVWLLSQGDKPVIETHGKEIDISKLKLSRRDGKGARRF
jgi:DNA gyrase subunit A